MSTFKPADANRNYPFKFFEILNIDKAYYMKLINGNIPAMKRFDANLYHVNFTDGKRRISVVLVARPGEIFAMYFMLPNGDTLYRFNYEGLMFQEQSKVHELSSSVEKDYKSKKDMNLSQFTRIKLADAIVQVYGGEYPSLRHIRINNHTKGYIWLNDKQVVGYVNVEEKDDDSKWIQALEIYAPYKGHGLSKQMLGIAVGELGATELSVSKNNEVAIKLYKSYGFKTYKSTDTMYFMSRNKNIDEVNSYYVKDPLTGTNIKTAFTDHDFIESARFAQASIKKLHNEGRLKCVSCRDIEAADGGWVYAEYNITSENDIIQLEKFISYMKQVVDTSTYPGDFELPNHISKDARGLLFVKPDMVVKETKKEVEEKGLKSYVNPARQLRIKNTIKRHDQENKGKYTNIAPSLPQPKNKESQD